MTRIPSGPERLGRAERLVVIVAALGFLFDQYELLTLPLILAPALRELTGAAPGSAEYTQWVNLLFFLPAVCGGVFGLLGGYLTDRFGRRRVLIGSILLYAGASLAAAFSTSALMLLVCRCVILAGVCVEFVAGIAWLAEMLPDPKRREAGVGIAQAVSSFGGLLVTGVYLFILKFSADWPAIAGGHEAWRYTCLSGVIPALPLIVLRPFLPESPMWNAGGRVSHRVPVRVLFSGQLARTTIIAMLATAASYALAYGAMQHLPRIVAGLPELAALATVARDAVAGQVQVVQEAGGLFGRAALVVLVVTAIARRRLLRRMQWAALVAFPVTFAWLSGQSLTWLEVGVFITAAITAAQLSFWGNYLPRVFPTNVRGTGESVAVNIGGRILGTSVGARDRRVVRPLHAGVRRVARAGAGRGVRRRRRVRRRSRRELLPHGTGVRPIAVVTRTSVTC